MAARIASTRVMTARTAARFFSMVVTPVPETAFESSQYEADD